MIKIDKEDIAKIENLRWYFVIGSSNKIKIITHIEKKVVTLGSYLLNPPRGKQVFIKNLDRLDFRKNNLIVCTLKERQRLLGKKSPQKYSSKFRGVSFVKSARLWRAGIEVDGIGINLGQFSSEIEAAQAWNKAAKKYFGKYSFQNKID